MTLKLGAWVEPARMTAAIHDAGFTPVPEDIRLTMTGAIIRHGERAVLVLAGMKLPREIDCVPAPGRDTTARALDAPPGGDVEVKGRWRFDGAGILEVESVSPVPASP